VGITYAIWAGLGTMLVSIAGMLFFKEPMTWLKAISIGLIILGVIGLNSQSGTH
jgi:small multidrug resistance pump